MAQELWTALKPHLRSARIALGVPSGKHPFKPNRLLKPRRDWAPASLPAERSTSLPAGDAAGGCRARSRPAGHQFVFAVRRSRAGDADVINEVYCHDTYRLSELAKRGEAPRVVFDFGSHIGTFPVLLKQLFPDAEVYCFEPHPESFALLRANTAHLSGVHLFNKALSYSEQVILIEGSGATGGNFVTTPEDARRYEDPAASGRGPIYRPLHRVETVTLEQVFRETGVEAVDLVKWDCEGGEVDAFRHMADDSAGRFRRMVGEYHVETGGIRSFLDLAQRRFPAHHFYGRDEDPALSIGWFAAEYTPA